MVSAPPPRSALLAGWPPTVCILSIAVMTLLYNTTKYDYHIWYAHHTCLQGSGHNSYKGHVNDSGEFWRVLGHPHVRHCWKHNIVDTFTHHICANGHGGAIGPSFPYKRRVWRWHSPQCNIIVLSLVYCWLYSLYTLHNAQHLSTRWALDLVGCATVGTTGQGASRNSILDADWFALGTKILQADGQFQCPGHLHG